MCTQRTVFYLLKLKYYIQALFVGVSMKVVSFNIHLNNESNELTKAVKRFSKSEIIISSGGRRIKFFELCKNFKE